MKRIFKVIFLIIVIIFILVLALKSNSVLAKIILAYIGLNLILNLLHQLFPNPKCKFIRGLLRIIDSLINVVNEVLYWLAFIGHLAGPLIYVWGLPLITLILFNEFILNHLLSNSTMGYLLGLYTLCILAYRSYWIVDVAIKFFTKSSSYREKSYNKKIIKFLKNLNVRKCCYIVSIFICIGLNAINLTASDVDLNNFTNTIDKILLTFVAIDCYVCTFKSEVVDKPSRELDRLHRTQN